MKTTDNSGEYNPILDSRDRGGDGFGALQGSQKTDEDKTSGDGITTTRSATNMAVLRVNLLCYGISNFSPAAIFPFFAIVMAEKTSSKILVGVIYASQPALAFLTAPVVPALTTAFGRLPILCSGLILCSIGCAGFGASSSVRNWLFFHAIEGAGNAFVNVPSSALLIAHSSDISEDLGLVEAAAGVAYVVGPVVGGLLYSECGFEAALFVLAVLHLVVLALLPLLLKDSRHFYSDSSSQSQKFAVAPSPSEAGAQVSVLEERQVWKLLWRESVVWIAASANTLGYAGMSFYDIAISPQLQRTLGLSPREIGFAYFVPCVMYSCMSPFNGTICRRFGTRRVLTTGCVLWAIAFLAFGPSPPLSDLGGRTYEWWMVSISLTLNGVATAPCLQASLPMVSEYFQLSAANGNDGSFTAQERVKMEDALSAIMSSTLSLGCILGPTIGGACMEYLPKTRDPGCLGTDCVSAFGWTTTLLSALFLLVALAVVLLPPGPQGRG